MKFSLINTAWNRSYSGVLCYVEDVYVTTTNKPIDYSKMSELGVILLLKFVKASEQRAMVKSVRAVV